MKINKKSRIGEVFRRIINIRAWLDVTRLKAFNQYLILGFKRMFIRQKPTKTAESFEIVMKRLNLSEEDIVIKQNALYRLSLLMVFLAILIIIYTIYHLFVGSYRASILSLIVAMIALVLAFRYHFWYFQIKNRKLGCTISEWYQGVLGKKP